MARLDVVLEPWTCDEPVGSPKGQYEFIRAAIREAYRIGHDDGRHARLPHGEPTFIDKLRSNADGKEP